MSLILSLLSIVTVFVIFSTTKP
jgi:hypothetical protein